MKQWFGWVIALIVLTSCQNEMIVPLEREGVKDRGDSIEFTLISEYPAMEEVLTSKGLSALEEKMIKTMTVLVFDESAGNETFAYKANPLAIYADGSFRIRLKKSVNNVRLLLLANGDTDAQTAINNMVVGTSKPVAVAALLYNTTSVFNATGSIGIPMWGESNLVVLNESLSLFSLGGGLDGAVEMYRSLSKIDVSNSATANFQFTSVRVYNTRNRSKIVPTVIGTLSTGGSVNAVPLIYTLAGSDLTGQKLLNTIYVAETQAADNTLLVIGGKYKGAAETYYKIPLTISNSQLSLERNYFYTITIHSVLENGFSTPEDATQGVSPSLMSTVTVFGNRTTETVFNGEHTLVVSESMLYFPSQAGHSATMTCLASAGFTIDQAGLPVGYTVDMIAGNGNPGELTTIALTSSENTGGLRLGYFTIRSGFISKRINLQQL